MYRDLNINRNRRVYTEDVLKNAARSALADAAYTDFLRKLKDSPIGFIHQSDSDTLTPNEHRDLEKACEEIRTTICTLGIDEGVNVAEQRLNDLIYQSVCRYMGIPKETLDKSIESSINSELEQEVFFETPLKQSYELNKFLKTFKVNTEEVGL